MSKTASFKLKLLHMIAQHLKSENTYPLTTRKIKKLKLGLRGMFIIFQLKKMES